MRSSQKRSSHGYALVSTMVIGACAITFLLALAQLVSTSTSNQSLQRQRMELRAAAEAGVDHAIARLNKALQTNTPSELDPIIYQLPPGYLKVQSGSVSNNGDRITVSIKISKLPASDQYSAWCSIYDAMLQPTTDPKRLTYKEDYWRIVESTATFSGGASKTIKSLLRPESSWWSLNGSAMPSVPPGVTPRTYFPQGLMVDSGFTFAPQTGSLTVKELGSDVNNIKDTTTWISSSTADGTPYTDYALNIVSNGNGSFGGNSNVIGNIQIAGTGLDAFSNGSSIQGHVAATGDNDPQWVGNQGLSPGPLDNIRANADTESGNSLTRQGLNFSSPESVSAAVVPAQIAAPSAPIGSASLPDLVQLSNSTNPVLEGGSYTTGNMTTDGVGSPITFGSTATSENPVRIFIDDSALTSSAVTIATDKFVNSTANPMSFQIWYQGTRDINLQLADHDTSPFQGLIYAPNAKVTTTNKSGATKGDFQGAIVAKEVQVLHNGDLNLMTKLSDTDTSNASGAGAANANSGLRLFTIPDENDSSKFYLYPWTYEAITYQER